jgi:hypothetical protein
VLFLSGVLVGAVGSGLYIRHEIRQFRVDGHPAVRHFILKRLTRDLNLTEDQKPRIGKIICRVQAEMTQFRLEHRPELERILSGGIADMKQFLTPEQQRKLDDLYEKTKRRLVKGHGRLPGVKDEGSCE